MMTQGVVRKVFNPFQIALQKRETPAMAGVFVASSIVEKREKLIGKCMLLIL